MRLARSLPRAARDDQEAPLADAELVRRAQVSPRAFGPLYARHLDPMLAYCSYRLSNRGEAEDAASTVFLKALQGISGYRQQDGSFRTWLFRIARNEITDRFKHRSRHPEAPLDEAADLPSHLPQPDDDVIARDRRERMLALIRSLPPREREVLELRAADLTTSEIAAILGISEQNVRTAQSRAVARMRALAAAAELIDQEVNRD